MGFFLSLAYLAASIADAVSTSNKKKKINQENHEGRIKSTNIIIGDLFKIIDDNSKQIYKSITEIYESETKLEYENNILKDGGIFEYNDSVGKISFWLEYQKELYPINYDLRSIWSTVIKSYLYGFLEINIVEKEDIGRYFLSISHLSEDDDSVMTTNVIYDHHDYQTIEAIQNGIILMVSNTNEFERYYDIDEVELETRTSYLDQLTNELLGYIEDIDESKYFISKFNYKDYFHKYKFDDSDDTYFDKDFALELFYKDLDAIDKNEKEFYRLLLEIDNSKDLNEYENIISEKIMFYNDEEENEDKEIDYDNWELYHDFFPIFYSYKEKKELFPNDIKLMFALKRSLIWLNDSEEKIKYSKSKIVYIDEFETYCLLIMYENKENVYYDFATTHINKESLKDIAMLIEECLKNKFEFDFDDVVENYIPKNINRIKTDKNDYILNKYGYDFSLSYDDNFTDDE